MMNENLVKSGVLDMLAVKNQELAEIKRVENEKAIIAKQKLRDKNLVKLFLWDNFPLAASGDIPEIPEKEFPLILKRARKYYLSKLGTACILTLPFVGVSIAGITATIIKGIMTAPDPAEAPWAFGGIVLAALSTIGMCFWPGPRIVKYAKILTKGSRE